MLKEQQKFHFKHRSLISQITRPQSVLRNTMGDISLLWGLRLGHDAHIGHEDGYSNQESSYLTHMTCLFLFCWLFILFLCSYIFCSEEFEEADRFSLYL